RHAARFSARRVKLFPGEIRIVTKLGRAPEIEWVHAKQKCVIGETQTRIAVGVIQLHQIEAFGRDAVLLQPSLEIALALAEMPSEKQNRSATLGVFSGSEKMRNDLLRRLFGVVLIGAAERLTRFLFGNFLQHLAAFGVCRIRQYVTRFG